MIQVYNLTNLAWHQNGKFVEITLPNDGTNYWIVAFDNSDPTHLKVMDSVSYECCGGCDGHECAWLPSGGNCIACLCPVGGSSSGCTVTEHGGALMVPGGGILLQAETVVVR
jgi:hypothetical protein